MQSNKKILKATQIEKFKTHFFIPPTFYPMAKKDKSQTSYHEYTVYAKEFSQQMLPEEFPPTPVFGYAGQVYSDDKSKSIYAQCSPGPSFVVERNIPARVIWKNSIVTGYMFPVDSSLQWANPNQLPPQDKYKLFPYGDYFAQAPVPMVTHLHGGEIAPDSDGHPDSWFTANGYTGPNYTTNTYTYPNKQPSTTLFYHDHTMGVTRLNVYAGMAGAYIIKDSKNPVEAEFNKMLPSGKYDIPIIIADKTFYNDGSLYYNTMGDVPNIHPYWVPRFMGNTITVNGKVWPNLNVEPQMYRFRILNASNARVYEISLSNGSQFMQIATDGGFVETPTKLSMIRLAPAERAEILIDFSEFSVGNKIVLVNQDNTPPTLLDENGTNETMEIMQFTVIPSKVKSSTINIPKKLNSIVNLTPNSTQRFNTIHEQMASDDKSLGMLIDGQSYIAPPSQFSKVGTTEVWNIINLAMDDHPMHLHLIQFQILGRQQIDMEEYADEWKRLNGNIPLDHPTISLPVTDFLLGDKLPPEAYEKGWKDTVLCPSGMVTSFVVRFAPTYMPDHMAKPGVNLFPFDPTVAPAYEWHCHILEHEDNDMMRPHFIVF